MSNHLRLDDWFDNFQAVVNNRLYKPFEWGSNDCFLLLRDVSIAITGIDIAVNYIDDITPYTNKAQALALIKTLTGQPTFAAAIAQKLKPVKAKYQNVGDIGLFNDNVGTYIGNDYFGFIAENDEHPIFISAADITTIYAIDRWAD